VLRVRMMTVPVLLPLLEFLQARFIMMRDGSKSFKHMLPAVIKGGKTLLVMKARALKGKRSISR